MIRATMLNFELVSALRQGLFLLLTPWISLAAFSAELISPPASPPKIAPASNEGELAMKGFTLPKGFQSELIAAEPHLANPVAFYIDELGRFYVCETFRLHAGVTDIRGHMNWLDEDLAARTPDDRLALMRRHEGDRISRYAQFSDRLKRIEDRDGDGKSDHSTVFADGFNHPLDGLAAGVIARKGEVWFANIPNLWHFRDTNHDGVADERRSLHYGYGVRTGFIGHDMHGLRFGPDGKLYFSIGDRGANVQIDGKSIGHPDTGAVFRCNPDGSELEVFAFGLRNPQELAFDQYGNLFTGDNNSDGGDRARWVHLVEGGDSGWRIGFQFIESPNSRGPWNAEKMWHPQNPEQPAFLVPPLLNMTDGPSGLAFNPGTGLPERYKDHFFLVDFHGSRSSGIHSFALKPKGASFEVDDLQRFLWNALPTDVDFGVDGGIYFCDWVQGWGMTGKGRIYRVFDPEITQQPIVRETKKLLAEGMEKRSAKELAKLLGHADMRVRQEAQFELASRIETKTLAANARKNSNQFARLHAIWGLGQIGAQFKNAIAKSPRTECVESLLPLLRDGDAEIRAQAAKVLGDLRAGPAGDALMALLRDRNPRVRFFAALGVGKIGRKEAMEPLLVMLRESADQDPFLRHAGVMGLTWIGDVRALLQHAKDASPAARMGVLLALRRLERAEIAVFLHDPQPELVLEAARAINDLPISGAVADLAKLIEKPDLPQPLQRRVLNANFRLGVRQSAETLAKFAARTDAPEAQRAEALVALGDWPKPSGRDRITGLWRPTPAVRDTQAPADALKPVVNDILRDSPGSVQSAAARAVERLQILEAGAALVEVVQRAGKSDRAKVAALSALAALKDARLADALASAQNDSSEEVRKEALRLAALAKPAGALSQLASVLQTGSTGEKQNALATLATMEGNAADELILEWLGRLNAGQVPAELRLDLLEAAAKRTAPAVRDKLAEFENKLATRNDPLATFRDTLAGGIAEEGRKVFFERAEASCLRCHKIKGEGGEVGPDLTGLGAKQTREYILEAILFPNKQIAPGFESVMVTTRSGGVIAGTAKSENDQELVLNSPEDGIVTIKKSEIARRDRGLSSMPEGITNLISKRDLRNLVEFLSTLK
ncbi:MAG: PVC-type heme-binding CxxCH protein [Verrucomicrobiota bacterium]